MIYLKARDLPEHVRATSSGLWFSQTPDFGRPRVGVVGSRRASEDALEFTHRFAGELAHAGIDVVSGGAVGIDHAAHQGCLDAGGRTWLISPVGLDHHSPPEQRDCFDAVRRRGILVSRFPPEVHDPHGKHRARNLVLVKLVDAVVIVQAGRSSGTLDTGKKAVQHGVPCLVLSGPVFDLRYEGSRELVQRRGPRWIHNEIELWDRIRMATASHRDDPVSPTARALLAHLDDEPRHLDWLVHQSGLSMAELSPALLTLSLKDVVREGPAGFWAIGSR